MKFIIFNGTLKPDEESNTSAVCKMLQLAFKKIGDECEIVTMRDLKYDASTKDVDDELKPHIMDIFKSDGIVFATPIWWGGHSSHIQSMFQRLDPIYSWGKDNKFQPFYNKVFGTLVSGGGDGFQHIHGNCYNFATNLGFTVPPSCNIESKAQGMDEIVKDEQTLEQVKNCAINMSTWARVLKEGNPTKDARHGTVDVSSVGGETDYAFSDEVQEEAAGVGIVTKQNATKDVPVGGEYMNVKKLGLDKKVRAYEFIIMPQSIKPMGLIHKPGTGPNNRFGFKNVGNNRANENFADGKKKGKSRPGRVKKSGASCNGSVTSLRSKAKKASGEKAKMYHWCANMKSGRKKK